MNSVGGCLMVPFDLFYRWWWAWQWTFVKRIIEIDLCGNSRNKWHTIVQKGCRLVALHYRAVFCVRASDAELNIDNVDLLMRIFFCLFLFFFPLRYYIFDHSSVQSVMYCCEDSWRNMEFTYKSKSLFSLWKAEITCASAMLSAISELFEQIRILKEILSGFRLYFNWNSSLFAGI